MCRRVTLAAVLGAALASQIILAGAASAAPPRITISSPAPDEVLAAAKVRVAGTADMSGDGRLTGDITFSVQKPPSCTTAVPAPAPQPTSGASSASFARDLDLSRCNGRYAVTVQATGRQLPVAPEETAAATRSFVVDAWAQAPQDVQVKVDSATRFVKLSWDQNPEDDIVTYQVQRQAPGASWAPLTETPDIEYVDESTATAGGDYRYRVVAIRRSADGQQGNPSPYSLEASASVPAPPKQDAGGSTGTTSAGGATTTGGTQTTTAKASAAPPLVTSGSRVDLSEFSRLSRARVQLPARPQPQPDPGFSETLPFAPKADDPEIAADGPAEGETMELGAPTASDDAAARKRSLGFLAGGLLATVLLMHAVWLKSEIRRAEQLESIPPEGVGEAAAAG